MKKSASDFTQNRPLSFVIVFFVYLLAIAGGAAIYFVLPFAFWLNLLIADVAATVITFIFSLIFKNASVYVPYWSVQPIVIAVGYAIFSPLNPTRVLALIAVCYWGVRLTGNWADTFNGLQHEDWRYSMLHEQTGKFYPIINFLGIHLTPTLIVYACVLPVAFVFTHDVAFNAGVVVFTIVSIGAATLQLVCDIQMHAFRKAGKKGFIRVGAWKYSRHPNYLGEISMWWGVGFAALFALGLNYWYLLAGAFLNTVLFLSASIPMADKRQSRKPGFEAYKQETWALLILPNKKVAAPVDIEIDAEAEVNE